MTGIQDIDQVVRLTDDAPRPYLAQAFVVSPPQTRADSMTVGIRAWSLTDTFEVAPGHWSPRYVISDDGNSISERVPKKGARCIAEFDHFNDAWVAQWTGDGDEVDSFVSPSTTLGGDLSGTVGSATVQKIQGRSVVNTAPSLGQGLVWTGSTWAPAGVVKTGDAAGGDLTGTFPNPTIATKPASGIWIGNRTFTAAATVYAGAVIPNSGPVQQGGCSWVNDATMNWSIQVPVAGLYRTTCSCRVDHTSTTYNYIQANIVVNSTVNLPAGTDLRSGSTASGPYTTLQFTGYVQLAANDKVGLQFVVNGVFGSLAVATGSGASGSNNHAGGAFWGVELVR